LGRRAGSHRLRRLSRLRRFSRFLISTESWAEFGSDPTIAATANTLQTTVICTMFGKPVPTAAHPRLTGRPGKGTGT
jgi:hypothetical protein